MRTAYVTLALLAMIMVITVRSEEAAAGSPETDGKKDGSPENKIDVGAGDSPKAEGRMGAAVALTGGKRGTRVPRSLVQACRAEGKKLCADAKSVSKCLDDNKDKIEDATCKVWVSARATCLKDADASGKCTDKESKRRCLRKLDKSDLSAECTDSDFYKAVQMYARWRKLKSKNTPTKAA